MMFIILIDEIATLFTGKVANDVSYWIYWKIYQNDFAFRILYGADLICIWLFCIAIGVILSDKIEERKAAKELIVNSVKDRA